MNLLELIQDALLVLLELADLLEDLLTLATASVNKGIGGGAPVETLDTRLNGAVEHVEMLLKQELLLVLDRVHNRVVVTNDEHDVLSEDAQLLLLPKQFRNRVRYRDVAKGLDLSPVLDLNDYL